MGMCLQIQLASDATIARVLADPPLVWQLVAPDDPELYESERAATARRPSLLARLLGRTSPPVEVQDLELTDSESVVADLDKSWDGINFLLTRAAGGATELEFLVAGGAPVGEVEVGYCPARAFTSREVCAIDAALRAVSDVELTGRYDPEAMLVQNVYPDIWSREDGEGLEYLMSHVQSLRDVLAEAVANRLGIVITLQ